MITKTDVLHSAFLAQQFDDVLTIARNIVLSSNNLEDYRSACEYIGKVHMKRKNYVNASLPLLTAYQTGQLSLRPWIVLNIRKLLESGEWSDALDLARRALETHPNDYHLADIYIEALRELGRTNEARILTSHYQYSSPVIRARHGALTSPDLLGSPNTNPKRSTLDELSLSALISLPLTQSVFVTNTLTPEVQQVLELHDQSKFMVFESHASNHASRYQKQILSSLNDISQLASQSHSLLLNLTDFGQVTKKVLLQLISLGWSFSAVLNDEQPRVITTPQLRTGAIYLYERQNTHT
jgi:tetratricopeptide (TPR) repeat protein